MKLKKQIEHCLKVDWSPHLYFDHHKDKWQIINDRRLGQEGLYDEDLDKLFERYKKAIE